MMANTDRPDAPARPGNTPKSNGALLLRHSAGYDLTGLGRAIVLVLTIATAIAAGAGFAPPVMADVIGQAQVIDGDTIEVSGERIRLHGKIISCSGGGVCAGSP